MNDFCKSGAKGKNNRAISCNAYYTGSYTGTGPERRYFPIGGVGRAAKQRSQRSRQTIADQAAVQPGIFDIISPQVALIAEISPICSIMEAMAIGAIIKWQTDQIWPSGTEADPQYRPAPRWKNRSCRNTKQPHREPVHHQDWDDLDHALSPHIAGNDNDHRKSRQPPVFRGVGYSTGRQNQSDQNDDRPVTTGGRNRITR